MNDTAFHSISLDSNWTFDEPGTSDNDSKKKVNEIKKVEETKIIRSIQEVFHIGSRILPNCKNKYDLSNDSKGPSLIFEIPQYNKMYCNLKKEK